MKIVDMIVAAESEVKLLRGLVAQRAEERKLQRLNDEIVKLKQQLRGARRISYHHYGENHSRAKLTNAQVIEIKRLIDNRRAGSFPTYREIAKLYGVGVTYIKRIARGERRGKA